MILSEAQQRCKDILDRIRPYCRCAEAAGDVRREVPEINRLVIVAVPITHDSASLLKLRELVNTYWGKPKEKFPTILTEIRAEPPIRFHWPTRSMFGWTLFEQTGHPDFVARALAHWTRLTHGGYVQEGRMYLPDHELVVTETEAEVFAALQCPFIAPAHRNANRYEYQP